MTARKVGSLALAYLSGLVADANEEWPVHRNSKPFDFALADLRALMAALECVTGTAENNYARAMAAESECARLRAALDTCAHNARGIMGCQGYAEDANADWLGPRLHAILDAATREGVKP